MIFKKKTKRKKEEVKEKRALRPSLIFPFDCLSFFDFFFSWIIFENRILFFSYQIYKPSLQGHVSYLKNVGLYRFSHFDVAFGYKQSNRHPDKLSIYTEKDEAQRLFQKT